MVKKAITAFSPSMQKRVGVLWLLTKSNSLLTESSIGVKIYVSRFFSEIHVFSRSAWPAATGRALLFCGVRLKPCDGRSSFFIQPRPFLRVVSPYVVHLVGHRLYQSFNVRFRHAAHVYGVPCLGDRHGRCSSFPSLSLSRQCGIMGRRKGVILWLIPISFARPSNISYLSPNHPIGILTDLAQPRSWKKQFMKLRS